MTRDRRLSNDALRHITRRHFFEQTSFGLGSVALASLMGNVGRAQTWQRNP